MNGNRSAEELLGEAVQQARMAASQAHKTQTIAIEFHQTLLKVNAALERIETDRREFRQEMNDAISELTKWISRVDRTRNPQVPNLPIINDDDWAETPTGHGVNLKMSGDEFKDRFSMLMKDRERRDDARKWRLLWKRSKNSVYLLATGALTLSGERFVQWLWAVLSQHLRLH